MILVGVFNSGTRCHTDYNTIHNEDLIDTLDYDPNGEIISYFKDCEKLIKCDVPLHRTNQDENRPNYYGYK